MAFDLILRSACIAGSAAGWPGGDIGIRDGSIVAMAPGLAGEGEEIDVGGRLVSPRLIESHIHLDKS